MKLGSVTKLDKRNTYRPKKVEDDVMSANYDVFFPNLWPNCNHREAEFLTHGL